MEGEYCTLCGSKLKVKSKNLKICPSCGQYHYLNPKLCNAAIMINEARDEVLLVLRKVDPRAGYWDLPGGFVDIGESLERSLVREIKEEIGITIDNYEYFRSYFDKYQYQKINYHTLSAIFIVKINLDHVEEFISDGEIADIRFFKISEIPYGNISFPSIEQALKDYFQK